MSKMIDFIGGIILIGTLASASFQAYHGNVLYGFAILISGTMVAYLLLWFLGGNHCQHESWQNCNNCWRNNQ